MDHRLKDIAENLDRMTIGVDEPFKFNCDMYWGIFQDTYRQNQTARVDYEMSADEGA